MTARRTRCGSPTPTPAISRATATRRRQADLSGFRARCSRIIPIVEGALADLAAGRPLDPVIRNAKDGAAEVLYGLGGAGSRQGDELAALIYLRLALYLRPDHALAAVTVADLYEQLKQNEAAIEAYELVPEGSPMRESANIQAGLSLDALGRSDEAVKRLQQIVAANPNDVDAWSALGSLQRSAKKFEDAAQTYTKAIDLIGKPDRGNWTLFYFRGICFERIKQWPKAEADFKKALELFPDQPLVLNYLGYTWVDQGRQSRRSVQDAAPRGRPAADRWLYRRQPRLGQFQARPL